VLVLVIASLVLPHRTRSQTSTPTATAQQLPQQIVYKQAFRTVLLLDIQAATVDRQGGNGNNLRSYFQNKAGLTAAETALLKSTAQSVVTQIRAIDEQIQSVAASYRASLKNSPANSPPPLPAELHTLQVQKDNLVLGGVAALQSGYGTARFQHLDTFVQATVTPNITTNTLTASAPKKAPSPPAKTSPLPPMQPIQWPQ